MTDKLSEARIWATLPSTGLRFDQWDQINVDRVGCKKNVNDDKILLNIIIGKIDYLYCLKVYLI